MVVELALVGVVTRVAVIATVAADGCNDDVCDCCWQDIAASISRLIVASDGAFNVLLAFLLVLSQSSAKLI